MPNWRISSSARSGARSGGTHTGSRFITSATRQLADRAPATGEQAQDRAVRDEPDQSVPSLVLDEHLADAVPVHQVGDQLDRVVLGHGDEVGRHQLLDRHEVVPPLRRPRRGSAGVHSATGVPPRWRVTIAAVSAVEPLPAVPWLRIAFSDASSQRDPVCPERTRRSMTPR